MRELELIRGIRERAGAATGAVRLGIGDDCAILRPPAGHEVLVTTDFSLEGRHFRRDWHSPESAGHRCLARGLSDLAAMGAEPLAAFLSLALPAGFLKRVSGRRWLDGFLSGFMSLGSATGTRLAGGDTATAPGDAVLADVVLVGSCPRGKALRRSGARAGDFLYVTGSLGGAAAELELLAAAPSRFARAVAGPHLFPVPRLAVGRRLRGVASAAMDLSDGLSVDLRHLCEESGVGAVVDAALLPLSASVELALHGGEDYELLFTARAGVRVPRRIGGVAVTRIGSIVKGAGVVMSDGTPLAARGWEHSL